MNPLKVGLVFFAGSSTGLRILLRSPGWRLRYAILIQIRAKIGGCPLAPPRSARRPATDCLLNYANQRDHGLLDRQLIKGFLLDMVQAAVSSSPGPKPRQSHLDDLLKLSGSTLEKDWLMFLEGKGLRLPSHAQFLVPECSTRPDFFYEGQGAAIYIDGHPHSHADVQAKDAKQEACLANAGYLVIRFSGDSSTWAGIISNHQSIFGKIK
jgi:hypothetical protein